MKALTVEAEADESELFGAQVSALQSGVTVENDRITGTLKYLKSGELTKKWGKGNFIALKFTDLDSSASSVQVGLDPSESSGLVEIIDDNEKNGVFKITNKDTQVFKVVQSDGENSRTQVFDLTGLECETGDE